MFYKIFSGVDIDADKIGKYRMSYDDFSGIYLQTSIAHANNYIEHKANLDVLETKLCLCEIDVKLSYITVDDKLFGDSRIDSKYKANILKKMFDISPDKLLMDELKHPIMIYDADDYELIIPHHLFNKQNICIRVINVFDIKEKKIGDILYRYV